MRKDILLDSSPIIAHMRGRIDIVELAPADSLLLVSLFTLGELEKGVNRAVNPAKEQSKIDGILNLTALIIPDSATAKIYGQVATDLEKRGKKIPENDVWIAATALECGMALATQDAHFERVKGLEMIKW